MRQDYWCAGHRDRSGAGGRFEDTIGMTQGHVEPALMVAAFEKSIMDPHASIAMDLSRRDKPMLIAFGGIVGAVGIPPFEFFRQTESLDINKIFVRDLSQTWYHSGLPGISRSIDETACFLRHKLAEAGSGPVVVVGNSMGGYAAILFGILIAADIVHAFSPHTFIDKAKFVRSKRQIRYTQAHFGDEYFDLREVIQARKRSADINIYYDCANGLDRMHARHLCELQSVTLHVFRGGGHGLIKILRDSGDLRRIVVASLGDGTDNAGGPDGKRMERFSVKPPQTILGKNLLRFVTACRRRR